MRYAQHKTGQKLHLVFETKDYVSSPVCGKNIDNYRMTINVPMGNACKNCLRIYNINGGEKVKEKFYKAVFS
jgi:hypothetical protein